jgi:cyclic 2,3-diphosphoglycerate synthetase
LRLAQAGEHAASDVYEDAVLARVAVAGARRAGAGPAGQTAFDTVAGAIALAETVNPDVLLLEGSGTAVPPCAADGTILVVRDADDPASWPLAHRLLLADLVLVRMPGVQVTSTRFSTLASPNHPVTSVVHIAFRPTPLGNVDGRRIFVATTAPEAAGGMWREAFERTHGALVAGMTHHLGDRRRLEEDLAAAAGTYDVLACELKAAAVDVAVARAMEGGAEVVFVDNRPTGIGADLEQEILKVSAIARERFRAAR